MLRRIALMVGVAGLLAAAAASLSAQAPQAPNGPQANGEALAPQALSGPIALRTMPRGTVLQATDVGGDASAVLGLETQRLITAGELLRAPAVAPAAVVRSGEAVTVRVEKDGIIVTRQGIALGMARIGQPVRVRVGPHSLSGIAVAAGVVRLP